ncbi:MAG: hypothetical protein R2932_10690 [Caldilineaceae bacterium]
MPQPESDHGEGLAIFLKRSLLGNGLSGRSGHADGNRDKTATVVPETATATMSPSMTTTPIIVPTMTPTATSATIPAVTVTAARLWQRQHAAHCHPR